MRWERFIMSARKVKYIIKVLVRKINLKLLKDGAGIGRKYIK